MRILHSIVLVLLLVAAGCDRSSNRHYQFNLPSAASLKDRATITFRGVPVGYITDIQQSSNQPTAVIASGYITNPQMRLQTGDTARIIVRSLLGDPQIEIIRNADTGAELLIGSTVDVSPLPSAPSSITNLLDEASKFSRLPPEKQGQIAQQIRVLIDAADADTNSASTNSR
jgi:ABC-type transporter Mla subunit MlaD